MPARAETPMYCSFKFLPPPYLPSIAPLEELKKIFIKDLRLETNHRGDYLLLRLITHPARMTAIMAIVEDEREDAVLLQLYQQDDKKVRPATSILKHNDIVIIKEPYFKVIGDGEYGLRVDHVSDLVRIELCDERVPRQWTPRVVDLDKTVDDWKLEGNEATMELKRVRCRLGEQERSAYDFKAIREEMSTVPPPHLDHATFVGPVTVKVSIGRGRGLFTTKAVKAGDLILCEKAFAHCYANAPGDHSAESSRINLLVTIHTNRMTIGTQSDLITRIVQKLRRNLSFLPEFMALHHGSYEPTDY